LYVIQAVVTDQYLKKWDSRNVQLSVVSFREHATVYGNIPSDMLCAYIFQTFVYFYLKYSHSAPEGSFELEELWRLTGSSFERRYA